MTCLAQLFSKLSHFKIVNNFSQHCCRHERDLIFDLSCPAKMNGTGFSNNNVAIQYHPVPLKKFSL
jgi:hypothetical protein